MLKDVIKGFLHKGNSYKQRYNEAFEERKIQRIINEREKNANERELERYIEEDRQKRIKSNLEKFRKQRNREYWTPTKVNQGWDTLKNKNNLLRQKQLFMQKGNILRSK